MSLLPLTRDEYFDRLTEKLAHLAAGGLRESGEFFVRLSADLCPNVLEVLSHYGKLDVEYVREKIESDPCVICGDSPLGGELIEWRGWTAKRVASSANRIDNEHLRVIAMVVFPRLNAAINASKFDSWFNLASADCCVYGRGRARLSGISANRARRASSGPLRLFVFVRPALDATRWASNALVALGRQNPCGINSRNVGGPPRFTLRRSHKANSFGYNCAAVHQAASAGQRFGRRSWSVTAPYDASTYIQQLPGAGVRSSRSSSTR